MSNASGIRAGKAYTELYTDDSRLVRGLRGAQARLRAFSVSVKAMGQSLFTAGTASLAPLLASAKVFSHYGDQVAKMAKRTGLSTETLSELRFVASQTGTEFASLEMAFRKMQRSIYDAGRGLSTQVDALADLNLRYDDLRSLSPEEQFKLLADRIGQVEGPTRKAAIAMSLFGRTGTNLIPMFDAGSKGIEKLQRQARDLGLTMDSEAAKAAEDFTDTLDRLWKTVQIGAFNVGAALAPLFTDIANTVTAATQSVTRFAKDNRELLETAAKAAIAVAGLGAALVAVGTAAGAGALAIKGLTAAVVAYRTAALAAAVASKALFAPFVASAGAIAAAAAAIAAVVGGIAALTIGLARASRKTAELDDVWTRIREAGDKQRSADLQRMQRLQALANSQQLNNEEMKEASGLIAELNSRYDGLGITLNEETGRIENATEAFEKLNQAMREETAWRLQRELKAVKENIKELNAEIQNTVERDELWPGTSERNRYNDAQAAMRKREKYAQRALAIQKRLRELEQGSTEALVGPDVSQAAEEASAEEGQVSEEWTRRIHQLRLQQIEEEYERQIALINERYDHEKKMAESRGVLPETLEQIDTARDLEIENYRRSLRQQRKQEEARLEQELAVLKVQGIEDTHAREVATIKQRYSYERQQAVQAGDLRRAQLLKQKRDAELALAHQREVLRLQREAATITQANESTQARIEELRLRLSKRGYDLQVAILELERKRALEAAKAAGESLDLVNEEYDLRRKMLDLDKEKFGQLGTFDPRAVGQLFTNLGTNLARAMQQTSPAAQQAASTRQIQTATRQIDKARLLESIERSNLAIQGDMERVRRAVEGGPGLTFG